MKEDDIDTIRRKVRRMTDGERYRLAVWLEERSRGEVSTIEQLRDEAAEAMGFEMSKVALKRLADVAGVALPVPPSRVRSRRKLEDLLEEIDLRLTELKAYVERVQVAFLSEYECDELKAVEAPRWNKLG